MPKKNFKTCCGSCTYYVITDGGGSLQMITVLHRGSSQMITVLPRGGPANDYGINGGGVSNDYGTP